MEKGDWRPKSTGREKRDRDQNEDDSIVRGYIAVSSHNP